MQDERRLSIALKPPLGDFLNELSNDGAKDQFATYLNEDIIPVMVHGARVSQRKQSACNPP